ncbi:hypothetical protein AMJ87_02465 [candidate division WOR_3 bacterium SM23_60]|uniref:Helicase ATP-binding domain-containing protein n=1 Tax=candidate division WOR_3 bacterium SM23_60 TaxID=1703780 RepID=A0A0S8GKN3_UNCW3|nr:MAG: hypothetical protein AMJ87_02465 [candidate division WOR_3 bacterium SM23_60]
MLRLSVRELIAYTLRSGDLDMTTFGLSSPIDAIHAHQAIQKSRPKDYSTEVTVRHRVETNHFVLEVSGRIDGVYIYPDRVIIDEIKTTRKDLTPLVQQEDGYHWGQAKCYAYIYAKQNNLEMIDVQLTYYHLGQNEKREVRRSFEIDELEEFFNALVSQYLEWARMIVSWTDTRNASMKKLKFPFETFRPGQEQMFANTEAIIEQRGQLLVQAPTGIGKTMAVLVPSIKAIAQGHTSQIFYLTARTTGRQAAEATLDILRERGLKLKSLSLTAKEKMCLNTDKVCNPDDCRYARGHFDRVNSALHDAFTHDSFTRDMIIHLAKRHMVCPFEFALELSLWVECVICDYNYAFDPDVYLRRFFEDGSKDYVVLVDEAHNLVDRAREMYSTELSMHQIQKLRSELKSKLRKVYGVLGKINTWMIKKRTLCEQEQKPIAEREPPLDLCSLLKRFTKLSEEWLLLNQPTPFRAQLMDMYFEARTFLRTADRYERNYATCYGYTGRDLCVKLFCIDPSRYLRETLEKFRSAIFFSGTLNPMQYFIESFGCDDTAATLTLPSPFEQDKLCVMVASRVSTLFKHRAYTQSAVANAICALVDAKKGNYLVFFPSYEYMKMIYDIFHLCRPGITTLVQSSHMSEHDREQFLRQFSKTIGNHLVGFAVMGGVFAESIDLIGERLTGAVIVGVGMPGISLERELIRSYFDEMNECGFAFAYQFPGMIKVLQAAGRVIRSETDRGAILLIDTRFVRDPYRSLLPQEWYIQDVTHDKAIGKILEGFWH